MNDKHNGYNGYKNYNHWNVSLWINNNDGLYRRAKYLCKYYEKDEAARVLLDEMNDAFITHTPDGVKYTFATIRQALATL